MLVRQQDGQVPVRQGLHRQAHGPGQMALVELLLGPHVQDHGVFRRQQGSGLLDGDGAPGLPVFRVPVLGGAEAVSGKFQNGRAEADHGGQQQQLFHKKTSCFGYV